MSLGVSSIIKYFNSVLNSYLSFFKCADDFKVAKTRFYWYFKYSLVSTLKAKLKYVSRRQVFQRYGFDITCLNYQGNKINFVKWNDIKKLKKEYLINNNNKELFKIMY